MRCRLRGIAVLMSLPACAPTPLGTWEGSCEARAEDLLLDYALRISIETRRGEQLGGQATITLDTLTRTGPLEGEARTGEISLSFEVRDLIGDYEINLEGTLDGEAILGDCEVRQETGGKFVARGALELRLTP